ncbi:hypothetical protein BGZ73_005343 [Actinomortierella ambigua]|nr:hypothetical protein BGZ73_005343 [Actinomortierella ambigua]
MIVSLRSSWQALVTTAGALLLAAAWLPSVTAQQDPMVVCKNFCDPVASYLAPCGGGATSETLQQDRVFTPTKSLGGCECNQVFYNALSSCLWCIALQGKNEPEIEDFEGWVANCQSYGYSFTNFPVRNSTHPGTSPDDSGSSSGLSGGAIAGIVIGVLAVIGLGVAGFLLNQRRKRTKAGLFEQPYTSTSSGAGATPTQAEFNPHDTYHNPNYPQEDYYQDDQGQNQYYQSSAGMYDQHQPNSHQNYHGYDQGGYDQSSYDHSGYNNNDSYAMQNIPATSATSTDYVVPPMTSPTTTAAMALGAASLAPRPPDAQPQSLRNKTNAWTSATALPDTVNNHSNPTLFNDKAVYDDDEELEPPRSRERFKNEHEEFRRSLTPPRGVMQSYKDDFTRPSFEREHQSRPSLSGSDRGSAAALRGLNGSTEAVDSPYSLNESPETNRRRERAAELFSAEGKR